jgi:hypothetical protein
MVKYPQVLKAFADRSLPNDPDDLKSYSISSPDSQNNITIILDCSSSLKKNIITKNIKLSNVYFPGDVPQIPQSMLDEYKSFLNDVLNNPEFVARSAKMRNEEDRKIAKRNRDEAKAKELGYSSVNDYYRALNRQTVRNFMTYIQAGSYGAGIPFVKGDVFNLPEGTLVAFNKQYTDNGIIYTAGITGDNTGIGQNIYVISSSELQIIFHQMYGNIIYEPMQLKFLGQDQGGLLFQKIN